MMPTVLLDPGSYDCRNFGDLAMLQVAVARWKALWPSASIGVITAAPEALASSVPQATPVGFGDRLAWLTTHLLGRFQHRLPRQAATNLEQLERRLKLQAARPLEAALALRYQVAGKDASGVARFLQWVRRADVVALTGGGAFTDAFSVKTSQILDTLGMAVAQRRRQDRPVTAIFGHGFGPLEAADLRAKAAETLPHIDLIAIREGRSSRPLLHQLGVSDQRILLTGDDAIELAYEHRRREMGRAVGVNVRIAYYAQTDGAMLDPLRLALSTAARRYSAPLVPVPISRQPGGAHRHNAERADAIAIRELLEGIPHGSVQGSEPESPADVIRDVGRCRVVVTGSYHGAVFALSQGIPAIAVMRSRYYRAKFLGLAEQFEGDVQIVDMSESGWGQRLETAIDIAWQSADGVRPRLLDAARRQIESSRRAYRVVAGLAKSRALVGNRAATAGVS